MIKKIRLQGLLSFEDMELELRNLNVLIGPNGSGKSNLIEALSLLQALPTDIGEPLNEGGISEWLKKGMAEPRLAKIGVLVQPHEDMGLGDLAYSAEIREGQGRYEIARETLISTSAHGEDPLILFDIESGEGFIVEPVEINAEGGRFSQEHIALKTTRQSILLERRDPVLYSEMVDLSNQFAAMRLYRGLGFGPTFLPRKPQPADQQIDFLKEDGRNLALIVNELSRSGFSQPIMSEFERFFSQFANFTVSIFGNQVLLYMREENRNEPIPATRWSDGMIRYLCLLAILCHPNPPGLICIDEPELGFHPDILPNLARLIKEASERTQIIITTHSKQLVDEFSDYPEAVVVCERGLNGESKMTRLSSEDLAEWLERYSLGELWEKGEIGGTLH